jgi:hypothetical protein
MTFLMSTVCYFLKRYWKKLKSIIVICLLLVQVDRSYGQDSLKKDILLPIVKEFVINNSKVDSYKDLPEFIRNYLAQIPRFDSRFAKGRFNGTDVGSGPKRKLFYILKSSENYILSYAHGGRGRHFHSVIFMTNGKEIENVYNISSYDHKQITELVKIIENRWYIIQTNDEF